MTEEVTYKLSQKDFQEVIETTLAKQVEDKIFNRFEHVFIDTKTVCNILKISDRTLYTYVKNKVIDVEQNGENKFRLSEILKINMPELRKKLRYSDINHLINL